MCLYVSNTLNITLSPYIPLTCKSDKQQLRYRLKLNNNLYLPAIFSRVKYNYIQYFSNSLNNSLSPYIPMKCKSDYKYWSYNPDILQEGNIYIYGNINLYSVFYTNYRLRGIYYELSQQF